jgi:hypothetical protein
MGFISSMMFRSADNALAAHNGVKTFGISQMDFSVWNIIRKDPVSATGICKALAAQWIVDHAYGGSLVNRLLDGSGKLNPSAVRMIMQNFILAFNQQETETEDFLLKRGILRRHRNRTVHATRSKRVDGKRIEIHTTSHVSSAMSDIGNGGNVAIELTNALRKVEGSYVQIDFGKVSGLGHATAAWIDKANGDACFYDPNYGEVWFANRADFFPWFQLFYQKSYQGFPCNFNGRWSIHEWGLGIDAEKSAYGKSVAQVAGRKP